VTEWLDIAPEQFKEKLYAPASANIKVSEPSKVKVPDQSPDAEHELALELDQLSLIEFPRNILAVSTESSTLGGTEDSGAGDPPPPPPQEARLAAIKITDTIFIVVSL
tara:strand:+ start:2559 stop:2882 length:324 start_codon:yes stop_codon:yes gene_type:complete